MTALSLGCPLHMLIDFKEHRPPLLQAMLFSLKVFLLVTLLAFLWEFGIEDNFFAYANPGLPPETTDDHIKYVATVSAFAFLALIIPTSVLARYIRRRDIAEDQAHHMATHDSLTNLPNRNLLFDRLNQAIAQAHRHDGKLAVMFIDLDGFKKVNDKLGHNAGDLILSTIAKRLTTVLRETDTVSRFGGDEFVTIIPDLKSINQLQILTDKIKNEVAAPVQFEGTTITVGSSIGYAVYPDHATEPDILICMADKAMYKEKNHHS